MEKIRLRVLDFGIADNHADNYILILEEYFGNRRLPIVIPPMEAQAIAIQIEKITLSQPLIHDLFFETVSSFGIEMLEAIITKFENGIFYSEVTLFDGEKETTFKARTSDAIALALRFRCPIFTGAEVMNLAGIDLENDAEEDSATISESHATNISDMKNHTAEELEKMLENLVENENYEMASMVRDELRKRNNS